MTVKNSVLVEMSMDQAVAWFAAQEGEPTAGTLAPEADAPHTPEGTVAVPNNGLWSRDDMAKIRSWISVANAVPPPGKSYRGLFTLMQLTAEAAGGWVPKKDAEAASGVSPRQLANELSALTKLGKKFRDAPIWPIQYRKMGGEFSYRMDPKIGEWWLDLTTRG